METHKVIAHIIHLVENSISPRKIDGRYSPAKVQPIVNTAIEKKPFHEIEFLFLQAVDLHITYLINAFAQCLVYCDEEKTREIANNTLTENFHIYLKKHLKLKELKVVKECSIADVIEADALLEERVFWEKTDKTNLLGMYNVTSMYGISFILQNPDAKAINGIYVSGFLDDTHDPDFPQRPFANFECLTALSLKCPGIESLPADLLYGCRNLKEVAITKGGNSYSEWLDDDYRLSQYPWETTQEKCLSAGVSCFSTDMFRGLCQLESLHISVGLSHLGQDMFSDLKKLRCLDLSLNCFSSLPTRIFDDLHELQELNLCKNVFLEKLPATLLNKNRKLELIDLSYTNLKSLPSVFFKGLSQLKNLKLAPSQIRYLETDILDDCLQLTKISLNSFTLMHFSRKYFNKFLNLKRLIGFMCCAEYRGVDLCLRQPDTKSFEQKIDDFLMNERKNIEDEVHWHRHEVSVIKCPGDNESLPLNYWWFNEASQMSNNRLSYLTSLFPNALDITDTILTPLSRGNVTAAIKYLSDLEKEKRAQCFRQLLVYALKFAQRDLKEKLEQIIKDTSFDERERLRNIISEESARFFEDWQKVYVRKLAMHEQ